MKAYLVGAAVLLVGAAVVHAGDRRAGVVYSNFTPDAQSTPASKQCSAAIEKRIAADYTSVYRMGETALRKLAGAPAGTAFVDWPAKQLVPVQTPGKHSHDEKVDAIVLVDCRPETRRIDVALLPPNGSLVKITLRDLPISPAALNLVAEAILMRMYAGFEL